MIDKPYTIDRVDAGARGGAALSLGSLELLKLLASRLGLFLSPSLLAMSSDPRPERVLFPTACRRSARAAAARRAAAERRHAGRQHAARRPYPARARGRERRAAGPRLRRQCLERRRRRRLSCTSSIRRRTSSPSTIAATAVDRQPVGRGACSPTRRWSTISPSSGSSRDATVAVGFSIGSGVAASLARKRPARRR